MIKPEEESELEKINSSLEKSGWYVKENFLADDQCDLLCRNFVDNDNKKLFSKSKIGRGYRKDEDGSIRNALVRWIDDWEEGPSESLRLELERMMKSLSAYFRLSLKRFESQFSIYNKGGFYHRHLDQHKQTRHRQVSSCLYLNDCPVGGELVLYKKGTQSEVSKVIKPKKGTFVVFISGDIYHEVKLVESPRYSISTWFRDDEILPFV
ncbi:MAG: SM-20-related protein [Bacteriovoracaceae bacterium]